MSTATSEAAVMLPEDNPQLQSAVALRRVMGQTAPTTWCSLSPKSEREITQVSKAFSLADGSLCDMIGQTVAVENALIHHANVRSVETNELMEMIRLVLMDPDGKVYATVATVPLQSFTRLLEIPGIGMPPFAPPIMIRIDKVPLKVGKTVNLAYAGRMPEKEWLAMVKKRGA